MSSNINLSATTNSGKPNFWSRVGKWFNKNGDSVGKVMQATGNVAMGVGLTGMVINNMNNPYSIWNFGPGCHGGCFGGYSGYMGGGSLFGGPFYGYSNPFMGGYNDLANTQSFMLGYHMGTQQNWRT